MAIKVHQVNENMFQLGDFVRVERRFRPEADGSYKWIVYENVHTGIEFHDAKVTKAHSVAAHDKLRDRNGAIRMEHVKTMGRHPVIEHEGQPAETTEPFVYVPRGEASSKEEALEQARTLASGK